MMACPCGAPLVAIGSDVTSTLVGYSRGACGQRHDDNCRKRDAACASGHLVCVAIRRRCPDPACGWVGKDRCPCHDGLKLNEWPKLPLLQPGAKLTRYEPPTAPESP